MKKSWRIEDIDGFAEYINDIEEVCKKAISKEPHMVTVSPLTEAKISAAQRKTYWMWLCEWQEFSGEISDESHLIFKERYLVRIFGNQEDPKKADFYNRMVKKLRMLRDMPHPRYHELKRRFLSDDVSIMDASVTEMAEYMNCIKNFLASEFQFTVTNPSMQGII